MKTFLQSDVVVSGVICALVLATMFAVCTLLSGCKGSTVTVEGCYKDEEGRAYCVSMEIERNADGSVPSAPETLPPLKKEVPAK